MDELVDGTLVAGFQAAQRTLGGFLNGDELGLVTAVGRGGNHVELGGLFGVNALEGDFLGALGDVQAVLVVHGIFHAVGGNYAGAFPDVEHADLTAFQEIVGAEVGPDIDALVDGHGLMDRHAAQSDHTVHVAVHSHDLVSLVQAGDEELVAGLFGGVALKIALVAGITNIHAAKTSLMMTLEKPGPTVWP